MMLVEGSRGQEVDAGFISIHLVEVLRKEGRELASPWLSKSKARASNVEGHQRSAAAVLRARECGRAQKAHAEVQPTPGKAWHPVLVELRQAEILSNPKP